MVHPLALVRYHADMFEHMPSGLDARADRRKLIHATSRAARVRRAAPANQLNCTIAIEKLIPSCYRKSIARLPHDAGIMAKP
jgi:hypothetical protein